MSESTSSSSSFPQSDIVPETVVSSIKDRERKEKHSGREVLDRESRLNIEIVVLAYVQLNIIKNMKLENT